MKIEIQIFSMDSVIPIIGDTRLGVIGVYEPQ
jgi:hypothetical protein